VFYISITIGAAFGFIASLMAFAITWNELEKHQFEHKRLWYESLQAAGFTFLFFLLLSMLIGCFIARYGVK
jgi:hypothetical protein